MKRVNILCGIVIILSFSVAAHAKISQPVWDAISSTYTPAIPNPSIETSYEQLDTSKLRGYVVVLQGGIAVARAKRFISWAEYDYRGVTVNLAKETVKTRRGSVYAYLQPGDVMAVAKLDKLLNTVYVGLISPQVYKPANRLKDKKFSHVTTLISFKLPAAIAKVNDPTAALAEMAQWFKPFPTYEQALSYSRSMGSYVPATSQTQPE